MLTALIAYNGLVFLVYALDKWKARHRSWRVSEATLLWLAALLGGGGALLGIFLLRHKTRKPRFRLGVPAILVLEAGLAWWLLH